jgi:hypothetical protein
MAFKRLRKIKSVFKKVSATLSPENREEWQEKFTNKGLFEFREQTAQVCRSPVPMLFAFSDHLYDGAVWKHALLGEFSHLAVAKYPPSN